MKIAGMRGKYSPMNDATPSQRESIQHILEDLTEEGNTHQAEVRYSTYIGPGCAADRHAITVIADGRIWRIVETSGLAH